MIEFEVFKDIKGYEGLYQISNFGYIKALLKIVTYINGKQYLYEEKLLKLNFSNGYRTVSLVKDKVKKTHMVHILVATHFVDNPENKPFVNHDDGKRSNNHYTNLLWSTNAENQKHSYDVLGNKAVNGERNGASKLNKIKVIEIRNLYKAGKPQSAIAETYGICQQNVHKIISKKTWSFI